MNYYVSMKKTASVSSLGVGVGGDCCQPGEGYSRRLAWGWNGGAGLKWVKGGSQVKTEKEE